MTPAGHAIRTAWTLILVVLSVVTCGAQDRGNPAVDQIFAGYTKPGSPGCALGVFRDGKVIYEKGYGLANIEANVPIAPLTVFDIGSTSKQFTAASILLLEKQGKLSIQDDVRKYIPELPDYGTPVTILNLLNHTSGVRDYLALMHLAGVNTDSVTTDDDALDIIVRQKGLNFTPGSDYLYSNSGYFLLSVIVKRVSGKTLREFARENIFTPLGMKNTEYRDDHTALIPNRALAYNPSPGVEYALNVSYFEQTGDGAVHTTVEDLQRWDENFYSGQVGGKEFLGELQERGKLTSGKILEYAKGLGIGEYRGLPVVSHGGAWGGYRAQLLRFPGQHFSVACLCNVGNSNPSLLARTVAEKYLESSMKPAEQAAAQDRSENKPAGSLQLKPAELAAYAGEYRSEELRMTYRLAEMNGSLVVASVVGADGLAHRASLPKGELHPIATDEFALGESRFVFHFRRDSSGSVTGFHMDAGRTLGMAFTRRVGNADEKHN